jgi:NAD(P)-dependent dehydrogenase (short-subunit alcohol dehydrogenase family)
MSGLEGKSAVVTGAGSGIGFASAQALAEKGARVVAVDINLEAAERCAQQIRDRGGESVAQHADVTDEEQIKQGVSLCIEQFGAIDIYYANAGVPGDFSPLNELDAPAILKILSVNLVAPMLAIKHAAPPMARQGGGSIICTASVAALAANAAAVPYSASKAGVVSLVKTAACELTGTGVRVNAICPGIIETGMTQFIFDRARERGSLDKIGQLNPLCRHGNPAEVANLVTFLSGDDSSYINGQAIAIDGGLSSSLPFAPGNVIRMDVGTTPQ